MSPQSSPQSQQDPQAETLSGLFISLSFWLCLLLSASLFATVALAPKLQTYIRLRFAFDTNQLQLVALERHSEQLQRVINAIRVDKQFAAELTRVELDAVRAGEEVIAVEERLKLDGRNDEILTDQPAIQLPWYEPAVRYFATESKLRMILLVTAAVLVIISFATLQPAGIGQIAGSRSHHSIWRSLCNRYVRQG